MAYIGNTLRTAQPNYQIIDDISASFNGSTTSFALQVGGVTPAPFPVSAQHCLISVGGVVQQPDPSGTNGFLLSGSNIVFSAAPSAGENFFGVVLAGADYINVGAEFPDGSVANPSITFDSDRDTGLYRKGANNIGITTNGTERVSVGTSEVVFNDGGEDIDFRIEGNTQPNLFVVNAGDDTVSFGGNLVVAAGHGIDFSADGNGRAGSVATNELLADYEEGTWTPTLSGGATASAGTMTGQYMKVGNIVHAAFNLTNSTISGSHTGIISGLPYTNAGVGRAGGFGMNSFNSMSSANQTCALITENATDINLLRNVASGGWIQVGITAGSNRYLHLVCTYRAEP